jgi:hypothetical protein
MPGSLLSCAIELAQSSPCGHPTIFIGHRQSKISWWVNASQVLWILYADQSQKDTYPSGQHDFIKKSAVCGFWKVATEDKSDSAMVDVDAVVELLGDADGPRDVSEKATATATASNTREVDRTTSEYDMMDLDMPGAGRAGMEAPASDSMDAARLRSQHHSPQSSEDFGGWQMVHGPIMTRQGGRVSTRVNPKVVLQHWAWVFQRP